MLTLLWLFYFIDGCTIFICLFVIYAQTFLMGGENKGFLYTIASFFGFNIVGIFFCYFIKTPMSEFMIHLANEQELGQDPIVDALAGTVNTNQKPKEKKKIEIPEFLFKYSSTFFKTATKKEVLFKKLFSPEKGSKKIAGKTNSERFRSKEEQEKNSQPAKSLKKTDLSMINFHLDVKGNQELMKHYRYELLTKFHVLSQKP